MSDSAYAKLCQETWDLPGGGDEFADHRAEIDGRLVVCFRGTKTIREWMMDFIAFPLFPIETVADARLGPIHAGFLAGALKLYSGCADVCAGRPFALTGHSLGGALATVIGAFLAVNGNPPEEIVTFGAPRAGMDPLVAVLQHVAIRQYRYRADPVPHLPTSPPFTHAREPLIQLGASIGWVFADHHITNYLAALEIDHAPQVATAAA